MPNARTSPATAGLAARLLLCSLVCALMLVYVAQAMGATAQTGGSTQTGQAALRTATPAVLGHLERV